MSDFRGRLFTEHSELSIKIDKLKKFILSTDFDKLPEIERTDLKKQLSVMEEYYSILTSRISRQCN